MIIGDLLNFFGVFYPETRAFTQAAGITDIGQVMAINYLVDELKYKSNLWINSYAIYPIVGGNANSHKFNLLNPQDTDVAYRLNFVGGITHSSNGIQGNGTSGYANTFFNPTSAGVSLNNFGVGCNSLTNSESLAVDIGGRQAAATGSTQMLIRYSPNTYQFRINNNNAGTLTSSGATTSIGNFGMNRLNSTQLRFTRNGTTSVFTQASGTLTNADITLMALNTNGTISSYSARLYTFFRIHQGLSDADEIAFQNIISQYNTLLGR